MRSFTAPSPSLRCRPVSCCVTAANRPAPLFLLTCSCLSTATRLEKRCGPCWIPPVSSVCCAPNPGAGAQPAAVPQEPHLWATTAQPCCCLTPAAATAGDCTPAMTATPSPQATAAQASAAAQAPLNAERWRSFCDHWQAQPQQCDAIKQSRRSVETALATSLALLGGSRPSSERSEQCGPGAREGNPIEALVCSLDKDQAMHPCGVSLPALRGDAHPADVIQSVDSPVLLQALLQRQLAVLQLASNQKQVSAASPGITSRP